MSSELSYWLAFAKIKSIGPIRFNKLIDYFETLETAWSAPKSELMAAGLPPASVDEIILRRSEIDPDILIAELVQNKIRAVTLHDDTYPKLLKKIPDAPPVLFFKGSLEPDQLSLAVVGSRSITDYGKSAIDSLIPPLARAGITIVSGLAFGVDAYAHNACIEANGRTIAVLASGLDTQNIYPSHHRYLVDTIIASGGLVVSEFPIGIAPIKAHFPQRNRIIAGLTQATIVIEAAKKSGSLITAGQALEYNRDVGAVPGSIFSNMSHGCNHLLQQGAQAITSPLDVFELLGIETKPTDTISAVETREACTPEASQLLALISHTPTHIDTLLEKTIKSASELAPLLMELEIKGYIKNTGGSKYALKII